MRSSHPHAIRTALAIIVASAAVFLASCGGAGTKEESEPDPTPPTETIADVAALDSSEDADLDCVASSRAWPSTLENSRASQGYSELSSVVGVAGRYHTGLDIGSGGVEQQAAAIARGRVVGIFDSSQFTVVNGTLLAETSPTGNSRLDGVVILKHTSPDSSVVWSVYGHLDPSSVLPFRSGDCINEGIFFAKTLASQDHHLHVELKSSPSETNPDQSAIACGDSVKCWGYTDLNPMSLGYFDPVALIFNAAEPSTSKRFVVTDSYRFRAAPARNAYQRDNERVFGEAQNGEALIVVRQAPTPDAAICPVDWYQVKRVATPNCDLAGECFRYAPDSAQESLPEAWVCGSAGRIEDPVLTTQLRANPMVTRVGLTSTLEWDTAGALSSSCVFSGPGITPAPPPTQIGTMVVTILGRSTFTLDCPTGSKSVTVEIIGSVFESYSISSSVEQ